MADPESRSARPVILTVIILAFLALLLAFKMVYAPGGA